MPRMFSNCPTGWWGTCIVLQLPALSSTYELARSQHNSARSPNFDRSSQINKRTSRAARLMTEYCQPLLVVYTYSSAFPSRHSPLPQTRQRTSGLKAGEGRDQWPIFRRKQTRLDAGLTRYKTCPRQYAVEPLKGIWAGPKMALKTR